VSLLARHLESNGIVTLIIGSAIDIVERCGAPRYLHNDFPLGNPCGVPYDEAMQLKIMQQGLALIEKAGQARTTQRTLHRWKDDAWRKDYALIDDSNREELRLRGEHRRQQQVDDKAAGKPRAAMISDT
jgi:D-proline reductase (dithiol) PrdB